MSPEFIICLNCESPCYTFEWREGRIHEAFCPICANDEPDEFITEEGLEALSSEDRSGT